MSQVQQSLGFLVCASLLPGCTALLDFSEPVPPTDSGPLGKFDAATDASPGVDMCGDGVVQQTEGCDDNNRTAFDGCSANCSVESGYGCSAEPSVCAVQAICPAATIVVVGAILDSCLDYYNAGYRASGRYQIDPDGAAPQIGFDVICDMATAGGGWTVLVNNNNVAVEPEGCLPRLATDDSFVCGTASCEDDFAVPAYGIPFTEMAWVAHDGKFVYGPHHLFRWATSQTLPQEIIWSLNAAEFSLKLAGLETEELIGCITAPNPVSLQRVANKNVQSPGTGTFDVTDVVTIFDQDTSDLTRGNMSFTDVDSVGLDDFQDGTGCADVWAPLASRGAASLIMIR